MLQVIQHEFADFTTNLRTGKWRRWGVDGDNIPACMPVKGFPLVPCDKRRPHFGPVFWMFWELCFCNLTHFNKVMFVSLFSSMYLPSVAMRLRAQRCRMFWSEALYVAALRYVADVVRCKTDQLLFVVFHQTPFELAGMDTPSPDESIDFETLCLPWLKHPDMERGLPTFSIYTLEFFDFLIADATWTKKPADVQAVWKNDSIHKGSRFKDFDVEGVLDEFRTKLMNAPARWKKVVNPDI